MGLIVCIVIASVAVWLWRYYNNTDNNQSVYGYNRAPQIGDIIIYREFYNAETGEMGFRVETNVNGNHRQIGGLFNNFDDVLATTLKHMIDQERYVSVFSITENNEMFLIIGT